MAKTHNEAEHGSFDPSEFAHGDQPTSHSDVAIDHEGASP